MCDTVTLNVLLSLGRGLPWQEAAAVAKFSGRVRIRHNGEELGRAAVYLVSSDRANRTWTGTAHSPHIAFATLVRETIELHLPSGAAGTAVVAGFDLEAGDAELHGTSPAPF
jgi:hypothetical protein